jgi:hypothetical protein
LPSTLKKSCGEIIITRIMHRSQRDEPQVKKIFPLTNSRTGLINGGGVRGGDETGDEPIFGKFQELTIDDDLDLERGVPLCDM